MTHLDEFQLNEYLDEALPPVEREAVVAHLAACTDCRRELADLQLVFTALDGVTDVALTADLAPRVQRQLTPPALPRWAVGLLAVQGITAVTLLTLFLWPTLAPALQTFNQVVSGWQFSLSALWQTVAGWITAVSLPTPTLRAPFNLALGQWAILFGLAFVTWLAGNGLLLTNNTEASNGLS